MLKETDPTFTTEIKAVTLLNLQIIISEKCFNKHGINRKNKEYFRILSTGAIPRVCVPQCIFTDFFTVSFP